MQIEISGNKKLSGDVFIHGSKNSVLPIIACSMLSKAVVTLENVPRIDDVFSMLKILNDFNVKYEFVKNTLKIDSTDVLYSDIHSSLYNIRASYYFIPVSLLLFKKAKIGDIGGCDIGKRPIDYHLKAFKDMGCKIDESNGLLFTYDKLIDGKINLMGKSVGATINSVILSMGSNKNKICNVVCEPEVMDVFNFLKKIGRDIRFKSNSIISSKTKKRTGYLSHKIIPDRIEAATYMIIGATCGMVNVFNIDKKHLKNVIKKLKKMGAKISYKTFSLRVSSKKFKNLKLVIKEYPGFSTDLQPIFCPLLTKCSGRSVVKDKIFEKRFKLCDELNKLNAKTLVFKNKAIIKKSNLKGSKVCATDLRCAAGLVVAGLMADGTTIISNIEYINRGYEDIFINLKKIGANINVLSNAE